MPTKQSLITYTFQHYLFYNEESIFFAQISFFYSFYAASILTEHLYPAFLTESDNANSIKEKGE